MNPQEDRLFFFFGGVAAAMSSLQVASQQPCHALPLIPRPSGTPLKRERAGIYGCGIHGSAHLNMKTRHCISGCDRVVLSGLWLCTSWKVWHIVIVCVPQTAVGVDAEVTMLTFFLIEILLFSLFSFDSPSFCIFALKYRLNSGAFYWK